MSLQLKTEKLVNQLQQIVAEHRSVVLANSLSIEDMLIAHLTLNRGIHIGIFSLDTGRLHQQTLQVIDDVRDKYGYQITVYTPDTAELEAYVADNGINGFYRSVEQRKGCCFVRKVRPLQRALEGRDAWITGMRRSQGETRSDLADKEWDANNTLWKYSPLADWQEDEIWQLIREWDIPYNHLYDQHFASIGCAPAHARSPWVRMFARAVGGGKTRTVKSAACTFRRLPSILSLHRRLPLNTMAGSRVD